MAGPNWGTPAALRYHARTKHSPASVRASARLLDWENRPHPFKEYLALDPEPLPEQDLGRLLRWGAGVVRTRSYGADTYHFRAYSSAGALYPVEVYLADGRGLFHVHPRELSLRALRTTDVRAALAPAEAVLVLTGILWRTAWKYGARGYRHLFWDAGTMLANMLALAQTAGLEARVLTGFVDDEVNRVLGLDGEREAALALLALGGPANAPPLPELAPLEFEVEPLSGHETAYPEAHAVHAASRLLDAEEVRRYRGDGVSAGADTGLGLDGEELVRVLRRRGSTRDFRLDPVSRADLLGVLAAAMAPIPADVPPVAELVLVASAVSGLVPGVYAFRPPDGLVLLRAGTFRAEAGYLVLEQQLGARAAATCFFLADLDEVVARHGNRGYRAAQLEGGIRTGRIYLAAVARGLGATASTFYDDDVTAFLAPGTRKAPLLCAALGWRR